MMELVAWLDRHGLTMGNVLGTLGLIAAAWLVVLCLNWLARRSLDRIEAKFHLPYEPMLVAINVLNGVVWVCALLLVLNYWGIGVNGVWTLLVSAMTMIGVGFLAVWTMVSNVTAGLFITIWHPFRLGHTVELVPDGMKGRVVERDMMFTVLREEGGAAVYVPNNMFFQKLFRVSRGVQLYLFEQHESHHVTLGT